MNNSAAVPAGVISPRHTLKRFIGRARGIGSSGNAAASFEDTYKTAIGNVLAAEIHYKDLLFRERVRRALLELVPPPDIPPGAVTSESVEKNLLRLLKVAEDEATTKGAEVLATFKQEAARVVQYIYEAHCDTIKRARDLEYDLRGYSSLARSRGVAPPVPTERLEEAIEKVTIAKQEAAAVLASPYLSESYKQTQSNLRINDELTYLVTIYDSKHNELEKVRRARSEAQRMLFSREVTPETRALVENLTKQLAIVKREIAEKFDAILKIPDDGPNDKELAALRAKAEGLSPLLGKDEKAIDELLNANDKLGYLRATRLREDYLNRTMIKSMKVIEFLYDRAMGAVETFYILDDAFTSARQYVEDARLEVRFAEMHPESLAAAKEKLVKAKERLENARRERALALASPSIPQKFKREAVAAHAGMNSANRLSNFMNTKRRRSSRKGRRSTRR
jgi:hypothetical protein